LDRISCPPLTKLAVDATRWRLAFVIAYAWSSLSVHILRTFGTPSIGIVTNVVRLCSG
jgi:hypothetical protein